MGPKKSASKKNGKEKSEKVQEPEDQKIPQIQIDPEFINPITFTVLSVKNLKESHISEIGCKIEIAGNLVDEMSPKVKVEPDQDEVELNFKVKLPVEVMDKNYFRTICSNPILVTFDYVPEVVESSQPDITKDESQKDKKSSKASAKSASKTSASKKGSVAEKNDDMQTTDSILGCCNFDILPILLGEQDISISTEIEQPGPQQFGSSMKPRPLLPQVQVLASSERPLPKLSSREFNIVEITLEAVYNPPEIWESSCKAATWLPKEMPIEIKTIEEPIPSMEELYQNIDRKEGLLDEFLRCPEEDLLATREAQENEKKKALSEPEAGIAIEFPEGPLNEQEEWCPTRYKIWAPLMSIQGRGALSQERKFQKNLGDLRVDVPNIDIQSIYGKVPRIKWDLISRHWLHESSQEFMERRLSQELWPFEFLAETINVKMIDNMHCMALIDFKAFMFPGVTKYRVASPLYQFDQAQLKLNTNEEKSILNTLDKNAPIENIKEEKAAGKTSSKKGSSKESSKKKEPEIPQEIIEPPTEPTTITPLVPIKNASGQPTFCIVQLEFKRPVLEKRSFVDLSNEIDNLIPKRFEQPKIITDCLEAEMQFRNAIRSSINVVLKDFKIFSKNEIAFEPDEKCIENALENIMDYLKQSGSYDFIKKLLIEKVSMLINQKFTIGRTLATNFDYQNLVTDIYTYISKEAHFIINTEMSVDPILTVKNSPIISAEDKWHFAMECDIMGEPERAKQFLLENIASSKQDPDKWLDYAAFHLSKNDPDSALECTEKALGFNLRHKMSMLLHGILLAERGEYKKAETFLLGLTTFYPHFMEGWVVLHLFYQKTDYICGMDATLQYACEIHTSGLAHSLPNYFTTRDYLIWCWQAENKIGIFLPTAALLLKLKAFEFAELCLAEELSVNKESFGYLYLLSVLRYYQGIFDDCFILLAKATENKGQEYRILSLEGHCLFSTNQFEDAQRKYELAWHNSSRGEKPIHLVTLRLADFYRKQGNHGLSNNLLIQSCKTRKTPRLWLRIGITNYRRGNFGLAEKALREANVLDPHLPEVWGYLALLSLSQCRYQEFQQCYKFAKKTNLMDEKIWEEIRLLREQLNYPDPEPL